MDQDSLQLLLRSPKKKYIKHLLEYAACLNLLHNHPPKSFTNPIIESFASDMELTKQEQHRLLFALSDLIGKTCDIGFKFEEKQIFSPQFDSQLKQILIDCLKTLEGQIQQSRMNTMRMGNKLLDVNWKLDLQMGNEKDKSNIPIISIQIQSFQQCQLEVQKIEMRGEQFQAFFANLNKIKDSLLQLVDKNNQ